MSRRTYGNRISSLEERIAGTREELAELAGTVMAKFIRRVLNELHLTDEQQAIADEAVPRRLAEVREALARGGTE